MTAALPRATFRDPAGSLRFEGNQAVRGIAPIARAAVLDFIESPLCQAMQQRGDLIAAAINEAGRRADEAIKSSVSSLMSGLNLPGLE